ncbi:MAG: helix-turn-helix domain-containing protein [Dokdonella sp.]
MPSIASVLKDEITRLCKKELRSQLDPMRSASARYRSDIADLKRRLVVLERQNQKLQKQIPTPAQESTDEDRKLRFVAKGLATLRKRLGITVEQLAALLGVSPQSIYNWQTGKSVPRRAQLEKLASIRGMGKREAEAMLNASSSSA